MEFVVYNVFFYVQFVQCILFEWFHVVDILFLFDGGQNICHLGVSRARWLFNIVPRVLRLFYLLRLPFAFPTNFFNIHGHWHPSLYIILGDVSIHNACMHA